MRDLVRPDAMKSAGIAAAISTVASYPALSRLDNPKNPLWYLLALLLLGGFVLWAFVFAWHERYTQRPVFQWKGEAIPLVIVTLVGLLAAFISYRFVDPTMRAHLPKEYPDTIEKWLAAALFSLAFTQLLLVFAPFDWALRLFKQPLWAAGFVILFGVFVVILKMGAMPTPVPAELHWPLALSRIVTSGVAVWLYMRHGAIVALWWAALIQLRFLPHLQSLT